MLRPSILVFTLFLISPLHAQERRAPSEGGTTYSLGQPAKILAHGGFSLGAYTNGEGAADLTVYGSVAAYKDFIHPAYMVMGWWGEVYGGYRDEATGEGDMGVRGLVMAPQFRIGGGVDLNLVDAQVDPIVTLMLPLRRGGIVGRGSMLRADWVIGRGGNVGLEFPLQRYAGKSRPKKDHVRLPRAESRPVPHELETETLTDALASVRESAHWIQRMVVPYLDQKCFLEKNGLSDFRDEVDRIKAHIASTSERFPAGRTLDAEVRAYHDELDRAFSIAAADEPFDPGKSDRLGREVAEKARETLLEEVILRYDRLLGQRKKNDGLLGLGMHARGIFVRWVDTESGVDPEQMDAVLYVFQSLIEFLEENRKRAREQWDDERLVWIPLQFALRPEQHDSQVEMDRLVERATQREFSEGNRVYYIINEKFQPEVHKQVLAAEDYHVLWIHDFRGVNAAGKIDQISLAQVVDSYLAAMTQRVREYDDTGKFPVYMILQDPFCYENNKAALWHRLLSDPLDYKVHFPVEFKWMEARIDSAQAELRAAVASSHLLQAEAREYGDDWLKNRVKVHVNVTNPADASFWSDYVMPLVGVHDNYIRDHRKISFYDVSEDDPMRGGAIYTGMGIGEHYTGATWEDRGILATGPALLDLRNACVQLLLRQGFTEDDIPHALRPRPFAADYEDRVARAKAEGGARALELHNVSGYGPKRITVCKAMIYTLMPPGSVLIMPDFVWQNPLWGSMAVGGALRGTKSLIVYPSLDNQPSPSALPQARARELFRRLVILQEILAPEIETSGGMIKTGFYDLHVDVKDLRARVLKAAASYRDNEFLRDLTHWKRESVSLDEVAAAVDQVLDEEGYEVQHYVEETKMRMPQLHMKAQFYASPQAWDALFSRRLSPRETAEAYVRAWARQLMDEASDPTQFQDALYPTFEKMLSRKGWTAEELEKGIVYLSVGSQNMDMRGMFLDGEVAFVASRGGVLTGLLDLLHVVECSDWVDTLEEVDQHMGSYGWFWRQMGRWATPLM